MNVVKTIRPNQTGASRFLRKYGKQLVAVRYRRKPNDNKTYTAVELGIIHRQMPDLLGLIDDVDIYG